MTDQDSTGFLTDENISQSSQTLPELFNIGLVSLDLFALRIFRATLLLGMETQVLQ
jgi:hypothetical protein